MKSSLSTCCLLLHVVASVSVHAQAFDERSISEPTRLSDIARDPNASVVVIHTPVQIDSSNAGAEVAAIEIMTSDNERQHGMRISLRKPEETNEIYLDAHQAAQFRDELAGLDGSYERRTTCQTIDHCVQGVARCRPSQTVGQAYCPGIYLHSEGERGTSLSMSGQVFRYPSIRPAVFVDAVDEAIAELTRGAEDAGVSSTP